MQICWSMPSQHILLQKIQNELWPFETSETSFLDVCADADAGENYDDDDFLKWPAFT